MHETRSLNSSLLVPLRSFIDGILGDEFSFVCFRVTWFLICLFEVSILYQFLTNLLESNKNYKVIMTLICLLLYVISFLFAKNNLEIPYFVDTALSCIIYFHVGFLFKYYEWHKLKNYRFISLLIVVLTVVFLFFDRPTVDLFQNVFPLYLVILSTSIIIALYWFINSFSYTFPPKSILMLEWCGNYSLALLGLHIIFVEVFMILHKKLYYETCFSLFLEFVVCMVISYCVIEVLRRMCPVLIGK